MARLAAKAALDEARVALIESQFNLASRMDRVSDDIKKKKVEKRRKSRNGTAVGNVSAKADAQPHKVADSWPVRRLAAVIPSLLASLEQQATAVVEADAARAIATADYEAGSLSIDRVLDSIDQQRDQTLAFLKTLTEYNQAVAQYVLTVLPPETKTDTLVKALVAQ